LIYTLLRCTGEVAGFLNRMPGTLILIVVCVENTRRLLAERRLRMLKEIESHKSVARTTPELGKCIIAALVFNPYDIPFALIYFYQNDFAHLAPVRSLGTQLNSAVEVH
jgi:hypothetical protein